MEVGDVDGKGTLFYTECQGFEQSWGVSHANVWSKNILDRKRRQEICAGSGHGWNNSYLTVSQGYCEDRV